MYWLLALLAIGFIVFVHEVGHFIVARRKGIPIAVFSLGFGPRIWGLRKGNTDYRISMIPFGGYVLPQMKDLDEFHGVPVNKRIAFSLGGPLANIVFAVFLLSAFNAIHSGPSVTGILLLPLFQCATLVISTVTSFAGLFTDPGGLSGVIGIASTGGGMVSGGLGSFLLFMALININLAIFNMLPLPVLDGGKILMSVLEKVDIRTRKFHLPITVVGLFFMVSLMLFTTVLDVIRLL